MSYLFPTYNRWPIKVKEASGSIIIDEKGKRYLDFVSGIAVCNLGHCHPKINQAIIRQLAKVIHVSNLFEIESQEDVAKILTVNSTGDAVFFCNSGTEANEAAIKLVRKHTGKKKIITFTQSFHGRTMGSLSATGQEKIHKGFGPLLEQFHYVPYNDPDALREAVDEDCAAIFLEVIQGEGGVNVATKPFIDLINKLQQKYSLLIVVDEVQTGIGRTGKPFAYQHTNLSPDIITVAKGLGNGVPVGALIGKRALVETFSPGTHGSTFGGNPLVMAAAKATLEIIFDDGFLFEVREKGQYLKGKLEQAVRSIDLVNEVRGEGLLIGLDCDKDVGPYIKALQDRGLLVINAGPKVIRMLPPLNVSYGEIDQAIDLIVNHLTTVSVH